MFERYVRHLMGAVDRRRASGCESFSMPVKAPIPRSSMLAIVRMRTMTAPVLMGVSALALRQA